MAFTYSQVVTDTIQHHLTVLKDQYHLGNRLLETVMAKKKTFSGGRSILVPVNYDGLDNAGSANPYADQNTDNNEKRTNGEFFWGFYTAAIKLFDYDILVNQAGVTRVLNMIAEEFKSAGMSLRDAIGVDLFSGTGIGTTHKIVGLETAIDSTDTYGGISVSDAATWKSTEESTATTLTLDKMSEIMREAGVDNKEPDLIITTKDIQGYYEATLTPIQTIAQSTKGDSGFPAVSFHGSPVHYDHNCSTQTMYFLRTDTMNWAVMKGADFSQPPQARPEKQWAQLDKMLYMPTFWIDERRKNAKWTGITG